MQIDSMGKWNISSIAKSILMTKRTGEGKEGREFILKVENCTIFSTTGGSTLILECSSS